MNKTIYFISSILLWGILIFSGCKDEYDISHGEQMQPYSISCFIEGINTGTRSVEDEMKPLPAEVSIDDEVLLLFFEYTKTGNGTYAGYKKVAKDEMNVNADENLLFTADIRKLQGEGNIDLDGKDYEVLSVANYTAKLKMQLQEVVEFCKTKKANEVKHGLIAIRPQEEIVAPFLMTGESVYRHNDKQLSLLLKRAVAKIVITANEKAAFTLKTVQMYNARQSTFAFNNDGAYPSTADAISAIINAPEGKNRLVIYDYETSAENVAKDPRSALCAIIGAELKSLPGNIYYYRININVRNDMQRISRNSLYYVTVNEINGAGSSTPDEALDSDITLVNTSQNSWDETFDGVYTYASDGKGFALPAVNLHHKETEVSEVKPHGDMFPVYWRNIDGQKLADEDIPSASNFKIIRKIEGQELEESDKRLIAYFSDAEPLVDGSFRATKLIMETTTFFKEGEVILQYYPQGTEVATDVVSKTIHTSLSQYPSSSVEIKNDALNIDMIVDENNYQGAYFGFSEMETVCPSGTRPMSMIELMYLFSIATETAAKDGYYYFDEKNKVQITLPYTGYYNGSEVMENGQSATFWTSSMTFDNSQMPLKRDVSGLLNSVISPGFMYGRHETMFPDFRVDRNNKFPMRCVRSKKDTDSEMGYIYKTYKELDDTERGIVVDVLKQKFPDINTASLPKNDFPVIMPGLYDGGKDLIPRKKYKMYVCSKGESILDPEFGWYRIATLEEVLKIVGQGSTFEKSFLPNVGYAPCIVTSDKAPKGDSQNPVVLMGILPDHSYRIQNRDNSSTVIDYTFKRIYFLIEKDKSDGTQRK